MKMLLSNINSLVLCVLLSTHVTSIFAGELSSNAKKIALSGQLVEQITASIASDTNRLQDIYKDLHQNPELGFMEVRTSGIVANELKSLGYKVKTGIGKTGVVAILDNGDGPTVMYRADMDANAVEEATELPYASKVRVKLPDGSEVPVSHMCGHDAHITWLLSLARTMATFRDRWSGTLVLVAQPAEELIEGGAAMARDGLFTTHKVPKPQFLIGLHTAPLSTGVVVGSSGLMLAGTEQLDITFHGVGGHGASPQFAKDPVLMAAYATAQYQSIISRSLDPREMGVITVGAFNGGSTNNVIPEEATLKLNFRFFEDSTHQKLYDGVENISNGIARAYGMPEDKLPTVVRKGYSSTLVNDESLVGKLNGALIQSGLVDENTLITQLPPGTGSEDIQMLVHDLEGVKVGYNLVGIAEPELVRAAREKGLEMPFVNHNPNFQVDLDAIPFGANVAAIMTMALFH